MFLDRAFVGVSVVGEGQFYEACDSMRRREETKKHVRSQRNTDIHTIVFLVLNSTRVFFFIWFSLRWFLGVSVDNFMSLVVE